MFYSIGVFLGWICVAIFTVILLGYGTWRFITYSPVSIVRAFSWHSFLKDSVHVSVGERLKDPWSLDIWYGKDTREIKHTKVLARSYTLIIPYDATVEEFAKYVRTLGDASSPLAHLLKAIVDERELSFLDLNEQEIGSFHEFKSRLVNLALNGNV